MRNKTNSIKYTVKKPPKRRKKKASFSNIFVFHTIIGKQEIPPEGEEMRKAAKTVTSRP